MYCSDVCTAVMSKNLRTCEGGEWGRKNIHTYIYTHTHTHTHTEFWRENLKERGNLEDLGIGGRLI